MKTRMKKLISIRSMPVLALALLVVFMPRAYAVEVEIPDENLEAVIRDALGIPTDPITDEDLAGLTILTANLSEITDLTGLQYCVNLQKLELLNNNISDISVLSGLDNLVYLYLSHNNISDISTLSGLTNLMWLRLTSNDISDISALSGLTTLERLFLSGNNISNITVLSGLTNIEILHLRINNISDIQPLVDNAGIGSGDYVYLNSNPLSYEAIYVDIPILLERGVSIDFDQPPTEDLITTIESLDLPEGTETSLKAPLEAAIDALVRVNEEAAIGQLNAFILLVEAQRGKKLTEDESYNLIEEAENIIDSIESG